MKYILIVVLIVFVAACETSSDQSHDDLVDTQLQWLLSTDPHLAVKDAIESNDFRYYGVYGNKNYAPLVNKDCQLNDELVIFIKGTSEVLMGYKHRQLQTLAHLFAEEFNLKMLAHRQSLNLDDCSD